jgi:hypothetical protein
MLKSPLPMAARLSADLVLLLHALFVLFVIGGGLLVLRWRRLAWFHLPAAVWGALIEFAGWICPLTPLENRLRRMAGQEGYAPGFLEHYALGALYPEGLGRQVQIAIGVFVVLVNLGLYGYLFASRRAGRSSQEPCASPRRRR